MDAVENDRALEEKRPAEPDDRFKVTDPWELRIGAATTNEELEVIYGEVSALEERGVRERAEVILQRRWVELDPGGALKFSSLSSRWPLRGGIICEWVMKDFEAGLAGLKTVEESPDGWSARVAMVELMKRSNSDVCLRFLQETGAFEFPHGPQYFALWKRLAESRLEGLVSVVEDYLGREERSLDKMTKVLQVVSAVMVERDPQKAISWGMGMSGKLQEKVIYGALSGWSKRDPLAVIAQLAEWKENGNGPKDLGNLERKLQYSLARSLGEQDFPASMKWCSEKDWRVSTGSIGAVVGARWRKGELPLADIYQEVTEAQGASKYTVGNFFEKLWEGVDRARLSEAMEFLRAQPKGELRDLATEKIWQHGLLHYPMETARMITALGPGEARNDVMRGIFKKGTVHGFHEKFLMSLPAEARAVGLASIFSRPRRDHPSWAGVALYPGNVVAGLMEVQDANVRREALAGVGWKWGGLDPVGAMAWVEQLSGESRLTAAQEVARGWAEIDASGTAVALEAMPNGRERDVMIMGMTEAIFQQDPEGAWEWSKMVGDDDLAQESRARAFGSWVERDSEAAILELDAARISENEREALRAILKR